MSEGSTDYMEAIKNLFFGDYAASRTRTVGGGHSGLSIYQLQQVSAVKGSIDLFFSSGDYLVSS